MADDLEKAIADIEEARSSHVWWAEHFQAHIDSGVPCEKCQTILTSLDMNVEDERKWVAKYDNVLIQLQKLAALKPV